MILQRHNRVVAALINKLLPNKKGEDIYVARKFDGILFTESFLKDCNFENCRKYAYDKITPSDESAAAILNSLPSKRGLRYSQKLVLGFLMD